MKKRNSLLRIADSPKVECPNCESTQVTTTSEIETFMYGVGTDSVELTATVPVLSCRDCGFGFTDERAEELRHEAICKHLGVMAPREILRIRKRYRMTRGKFAEVTKIGEASLSRWETGVNVQNAAYDQFLYLMMFSDNMERLRNRFSVTGPDEVCEERKAQNVIDVPRRQWRVLRETEEVQAQASVFQLRPTGT